MYSILNKVSAIQTPFGFKSVFRMTPLLKLEIAVCFHWFSLPVHSGSMKIIKYSKLYSLVNLLPFEYVHCFLMNKLLILISLLHMNIPKFVTEIMPLMYDRISFPEFCKLVTIVNSISYFICCHCSWCFSYGIPKKRPRTSSIVQLIFYF